MNFAPNAWTIAHDAQVEYQYPIDFSPSSRIRSSPASLSGTPSKCVSAQVGVYLCQNTFRTCMEWMLDMRLWSRVCRWFSTDLASNVIFSDLKVFCVSVRLWSAPFSVDGSSNGSIGKSVECCFLDSSQRSLVHLLVWVSYSRAIRNW